MFTILAVNPQIKGYDYYPFFQFFVSVVWGVVQVSLLPKCSGLNPRMRTLSTTGPERKGGRALSRARSPHTRPTHEKSLREY